MVEHCISYFPFTVIEYHDPNHLIDKSLYFGLWFHRGKCSEQTSKNNSKEQQG